MKLNDLPGPKKYASIDADETEYLLQPDANREEGSWRLWKM